MKYTHLLLLGCVVFGTFACSTTPDKPDCPYADGSNQAAPNWVCAQNLPANKHKLLAVVYADKSAAGINFMQQAALSAARRELIGLFKQQLAEQITQYAQRLGMADKALLSELILHVKQQATASLLQGERVVRQRLTPKGDLVMMVVVNDKNALAMRKKALRLALQTQPDLWQKLQPQSNLEEIFTAIFAPQK